MKISAVRSRISTGFLGLILLATLAWAMPGRVALAQAPPAPATSTQAETKAVENPATKETPKSEEEQEKGFLNAPSIYKIAGLLHISEPAARNILLAINFLIIFLAIVIPLGRLMPHILRKRTQNLRHNLETARQATEEARQRMNAVEAKLAGLDKEIAAFRTQIEQESLEDEKRIKASLKEESERIVSAAEMEINAAAAHARRTLKSFAADLAIQQAEKDLKLTAEGDRALISEFIAQVGKDAGAPAGGKK